MLGAMAVMAVAAFLPWASALGISISGIRGDGVITLLLAVAGAAIILANRTSPRTSVILEALLAAVALVVAFYHVNDPFAAIGIYLTLIAALVWAGSLAWWWADARRGLRAGVEAARPSLADLLSRRGLERPCETLVAWAREA
jgi:hypothetical protein